MKIGAQFYTLHEFCTTTEKLAEALERVADIGYTTVQISGTCAYDPLWLREQLDKNGLSCVLTHIPRERLVGEALQVAKDHDVLGCRYIGLGSFVFDENEDGQHFEQFVQAYRPTMQTFCENGKYFMYHNHNHEFRKFGDKVYLQHLADSVSNFSF